MTRLCSDPPWPAVIGSGGWWRRISELGFIFFFFFLWRAAAGQFLLLLSSWGQSDTRRARLSTNSIYRSMWEAVPRALCGLLRCTKEAPPPPLIFIHAVVLPLFFLPHHSLSCGFIYFGTLHIFPLHASSVNAGCRSHSLTSSPAGLKNQTQTCSMHTIQHTVRLHSQRLFFFKFYELSVVSWLSSFFFSHLPACLSSYRSFTPFLLCFCEISHRH